MRLWERKVRVEEVVFQSYLFFIQGEKKMKKFMLLTVGFEQPIHCQHPGLRAHDHVGPSSVLKYSRIANIDYHNDLDHYSAKI